MEGLDVLKISEDKKKYILESLNPILEELTEECMHKMPKDAVLFMLDWLRKKKAEEEDKQLTPEEKERLTKENDELVLKVNKLKRQVQEVTKMASKVAIVEEEDEDIRAPDALPSNPRSAAQVTLASEVQAKAWLVLS
ncbi:unnamed protein product [Effrenium voratum]|nr:unnamed protein product [Effrenium voratum]